MPPGPHLAMLIVSTVGIGLWMSLAGFEKKARPALRLYLTRPRFLLEPSGDLGRRLPDVAVQAVLLCDSL